ncbi:MAG: c-type cytochrome [Nitrospirota bacterium]
MDMRRSRVHTIVSLLGFIAAAPLSAAERNMLQPRVPSDKLAEARALTNPLPDAPDVVEKGKALYHGKGTCFNCHGASGRGDGIVAMGLEPSPRNFHHHGFWRHRTEGEVFWVIKHGSPGTAMIGFGNVLTDEEIWAIIRYERSFAGDHVPGEHMGPRRGMGPRSGMGDRGSRERECCAESPEGR